MFLGRFFIGFGYGHIVPEMNDAVLEKLDIDLLPPEVGDKMGSTLHC